MDGLPAISPSLVKRSLTALKSPREFESPRIINQAQFGMLSDTRNASSRAILRTSSTVGVGRMALKGKNAANPRSHLTDVGARLTPHVNGLKE